MNPYARRLGFPDHRTRTRRDHVKYLTLIETIALLHQHQRPVKTVEHEGKLVEYIEVTLDDVSWANRLAHQVLGRSLDELAPQTRRMLGLLDAHVAAGCAKQAMERKDFRFSREDVREATGFGITQTRVHLDRLVELEYVVVHRGQSGQSFVYELVYDGKADRGGPTPGWAGRRRSAGEHNCDGDLAGVKGAAGGGLAARWRPGGGHLAGW